MTFVDDYRDDVLELVRERARNGQSFITITHVKDEFGLDGSPAGRILARLEDDGHLERWGGGSCASYRITLDEPRLVTDGGTPESDRNAVCSGGVDRSSGAEQVRLEVGDTRKPVVIKRAQRVTTGDLAALAMCAHLYDPKDVRGWYTHEFDDVVRQWITSNVESVIARLSPHCEYTRGELPPLHRADDLWVGGADTGPTQTTLAVAATDGGRDD